MAPRWPDCDLDSLRLSIDPFSTFPLPNAFSFLDLSQLPKLCPCRPVSPFRSSRPFDRRPSPCRQDIRLRRPERRDRSGSDRSGLSMRLRYSSRVSVSATPVSLGLSGSPYRRLGLQLQCQGRTDRLITRMPIEAPNKTQIKQETALVQASTGLVHQPVHKPLISKPFY